MDRPRATNVPTFVLCAGIATAALAWAAIRWPSGRSLFGFESAYWDLGLLPALAASALAAYRLKSATGPQKRFLIGFLSCGLIAAVAYTASCSRAARWSPVSVLQPFQTGFMLAPGMRTSWRDLRPWGIFVDSVILVLIPLLPALLGGLAVSVRITLRRMMVAVAIVAILLWVMTATIHRARHQDRMGYYHRDQIVGALLGHAGPDARIVFEPQSVDRSGKAVPPHQQRLDRWHEAMAQKYWHSSYYPWSAAVRETPPPE
jgi:hypothetical protein